ncbi:delta 1-pyrroline-5-carboxylate reductase [Naganishia albida]|nr:delta 1-pyrroline-5-carboxylate reductase [Naganishia albida]
MGYTLAVIGCGTMGHAILSGIFTRLHTAPEDLPSSFIATVGRESSIPSLRDSFSTDYEISFKFGDEGNLEAIKAADMVLLACKPYMAKTILQKPGVRDALKGKVLASVLAGVTMSQLSEWAGEECEVVRTMTNTPSKIGAGMTLLTPTSNATTSQRLQAIFSSCGRVLTIPETNFDACTALAGSGPAFVAVMVDALADGAVLMGLPRKAAVEMAAQTLMGTAQMILETGVHPAALKDGVTTPGGCTIAGLMRMEDGNIRSTLARTIEAATRHAAGLGQEKK